MFSPIGIALWVAILAALAATIYLMYMQQTRYAEEVSNETRALAIAEAYRDLTVSQKCSIAGTEVPLATARAALTLAGEPFAGITDETDWRIAYQGDANRQTIVEVYRIDSSGNRTRGVQRKLSEVGGEDGSEFLDALFTSRICP